MEQPTPIQIDKSRVDRLSPFRRHLNTCPHKSKGQSYGECECPIWAYGYIDGRQFRRSLGTNNLHDARFRIDRILGTETLDMQGLTALPLIRIMRDKAISLERFKEARKLLDANAHATGYVYFISCQEVPLVKIGYASKNWRKRFITIRTGSPVELFVEAVTPGTLRMERELHRIFDATRARHEWFERTDDLVALIDYAATARSMLYPVRSRAKKDLAKCS